MVVLCFYYCITHSVLSEVSSPAPRVLHSTTRLLGYHSTRPHNDQLTRPTVAQYILYSGSFWALHGAHLGLQLHPPSFPLLPLTLATLSHLRCSQLPGEQFAVVVDNGHRRRCCWMRKMRNGFFCYGFEGLEVYWLARAMFGLENAFLANMKKNQTPQIQPIYQNFRQISSRKKKL
jgi:hypothetical protein